ncbi:2-hydroxyacid dehydrogenase [Pseudomonas sp. FEN]|uniref:2-hydroxyacid dehydrogenase n=1 Tax=Pseudomonas sp. FEN TaxID=2767468 RepID=UPI00174C484C|nr:2-hydroxyacid dehydrogenase [Pseudomonas sp. FEN]
MVRDLLVLIELAPESLAHLEAAGFKAHMAVSAEAKAGTIKAIGPQVQAVLTNGSTGLSVVDMAALPQLRIVCAQGAGYEKIDLLAARARNIIVTHGPGTNDASVADHAIALLMAIVRGIPQADAAVRRGQWSQSRQPRPMLSKKKLGILGLGNIGQQIARRGIGGFEMSVGYHSRRPREGSPFSYFDTPVALASWADFLIVATPGGASTFHLVDAAVLNALGPNGYLVNIARGSVVDTVALISALTNREVAGAALDVVEGEPDVPAAFANLNNLILTPHIAGRSPEAVTATLQLVIENLKAHFSGGPVLTPVP